MKLPALPSLTKLEIGAGLLVGLAAVAVVVWAVRKGATGVGQSVGKAAGDFVGGAVVGIGDAVGIPETDADRCRAAIAAGKTLDVSLYCPAGTFLKYLAGVDTSADTAPASPSSDAAASGDLAPYIGGP